MMSDGQCHNYTCSRGKHVFASLKMQICEVKNRCKSIEAKIVSVLKFLYVTTGIA